MSVVAKKTYVTLIHDEDDTKDTNKKENDRMTTASRTMMF
jgi:hypothetical protein